MRVQYRRHWIAVSLDDKKLVVTFETGWKNEVKIGVQDRIYDFKLGEVREFYLST